MKEGISEKDFIEIAEQVARANNEQKIEVAQKALVNAVNDYEKKRKKLEADARVSLLEELYQTVFKCCECHLREDGGTLYELNIKALENAYNALVKRVKGE